MYKKLLLLTLTIIISIYYLFYLFIIPQTLSNRNFLNFIENIVSKNNNTELIIQKPKLKTSFKPEIEFKIDLLSFKKDDKIILDLKNFDLKFNFYSIFKRVITLEKLGADEIYIDINKLQELSFKKSNKSKKDKRSFFKIYSFSSLFYIKKCTILYQTPEKVKVKLYAKDLEISDLKDPKFIHFGIFLDLYHNEEHLRIFFKDKNNVFIKDRKLHIKNLKFYVEKSIMNANLLLDENNHFDFSLESDNFEMDNIRRFLNTNLVIPNGDSFVSCFKDFSGDFKFKFNITNKDINGLFKINQIKTNLIPLNNMPLTLTNGLITIDSKDIKFEDFKGYYGTNIKNKINMTGFIKDYTKTVNTELSIKGIAYNEFAKYLSDISGIDIQIINKTLADFKIIFDIKSNLSILGNIIVPKDSDVLFENSSISPNKFQREFFIDIDILKEILSINNIDYHILKDDLKKTKPLITISGKINIITGILQELGFNIPEPLPTEFLNVLIGQNLFRNGTFDGKMQFVNEKIPYLKGNITIKDSFIMSQGLILKNLELITKNNEIDIKANGIIRRAKYDFNTKIENKILFPLIIKNINLSLDEIDVEKVIQTFKPRPQQRLQRKNSTNNQKRKPIKLAQSNISKEIFFVEQKENKKETTKDNEEEIVIVFQPNLLEIKNGLLNVKNGIYKKIKFGNINAKLTLNKEGILDIQSNKFDFAEGISTLKIYCDLAKEKYNIRLGTKNVDTDAISTSILNLPKEITGKTNALIELNTDNKQKLNGKIQFEINNGSITKLGLIQYVLNMASVFRNPITMISPTSIIDIINIPEGTFNKIDGTLLIKENSIKNMMIKSSAPQLSAFIIGRIDLENMDASLRIYTKFNDKKNGILGFLRHFSLYTLTRKAKTYTKGENISYYATELNMLPKLETGEDTAHVFLTKFDGNIQSTNFISSLKKIK